MDSQSQQLDINNYDIKMVKKLFCDATQKNTFYNEYTLIDVEEAKKAVYMDILRKYNYDNKEVIQIFVSSAANMLINDLFKSNEIGMNTQMVGVKNVIKDPRKLNKTYFNETYRIVNIDSMYRSKLWHQNNEYDSRTSTSMMVELNDELDNVVCLELANINIPFTFYNIDESYGNNYFYVEVSGNSTSLQKISVDSGNYTNSTLITAINDSLTAAGFSITFSINNLSNKVKITNDNLSGGDDYNIIFYDHLDSDQSFTSQNTNSLSPDTQAKINNNLGWLLGFRNIGTESLTVEYGLELHKISPRNQFVLFHTLSIL